MTKRKRKAPDHLLTSLNSYHPNFLFTVAEEPNRFLDTAFVLSDGKFTTTVYKKPEKFQGHWKS